MPRLESTGVDACVKCGGAYKLLYKLYEMHQCIVMMNLPCNKLPFSWSFIANCIMETSTYYSLQILVYPFGLMELIYGAQYFPDTVRILYDQSPLFMDSLK
jgi:hypothetical protein